MLDTGESVSIRQTFGRQMDRTQQAFGVQVKQGKMYTVKTEFLCSVMSATVPPTDTGNTAGGPGLWRTPR